MSLKKKGRTIMKSPEVDQTKSFVARRAKPALLALLLGGVVVSLALFVARAGESESERANHVHWDLISVDFTTTPVTINPGGVDTAHADANHKIKMTGSGTFVAPASGGTSRAVTGGGMWETFGPGGVSTGSGTYEVTGLVSWQFANFQLPVLKDNVDHGKAANGNAFLRISYSDGSTGVLGVGCHGPGAPDGIQEGIVATKDFMTYWTRVDGEGFTVFHLRE